jgi:Tol biopolymer transport system component
MGRSTASQIPGRGVEFAAPGPSTISRDPGSPLLPTADDGFARRTRRAGGVIVNPRGITATLLSASLIAVGANPAAAADHGGPPAVVSVADGSGQSISADGRYVVFESNASNLVPGDTNEVSDVFVRDRRTGTTGRVNLSSSGQQTPPAGDEDAGVSGGGSVSADGRYVAFRSYARNLVPDATFGAGSIFVRDRRAGTTRLVSVNTDGTPMGPDAWEPMISGNGRYVVFSHFAGDLADVYRYDLRTARIAHLPAATTWWQAGGHGPGPRISADGRFVAFTSDAALTPGDTNGAEDVFVHDFTTGATRKVTVRTTKDSYAGGISGDGRHVVFASTDATLVPGDTNGQPDIFVHDLRTGITRRVNVSGTGAQSNAMSYDMTISGDGRLIGFASTADNLVPGDTNGYLDVFLHDRRTATTVRVSEPNGGGEADGESAGPMISADGRHIAFTSTASNLVGDTGPDNSRRVYVRPVN